MKTLVVARELSHRINRENVVGLGPLDLWSSLKVMCKNLSSTPPDRLSSLNILQFLEKYCPSNIYQAIYEGNPSKIIAAANACPPGDYDEMKKELRKLLDSVTGASVMR